MSSRCVTLFGLMGAGKTAVGEALADTIGYDFIDTDDLIIERAGKSIPEIFQQDGEKEFRRIECEVITDVGAKMGQVIATGGGAIMNAQNRALLGRIGLTVYLKASAHELYQRIKNANDRPLLNGVENPKERLQTLLDEREQFYLEADIIIDTEDLAVEEVTDRLIDELARLTQGDG